MNISYNIAKRIRNSKKGGFSGLISKIAIASIAFGLLVMIVSVCIFEGFKKNIQEKIFCFASHIQISKHDKSNSYEEVPVSKKSKIYQSAKTLPVIKHIQVYGRKAGLLKTDSEVIGAVFKGVGTDFDTVSFKQNIIAGKLLDFSDSAYSKEIVISKKISDKLNLNIGDEVVMFFVQEPPRSRKLKVRAIYETGIEDFDGIMVFGDIRLIQRLNDWEDDMVGGFEIFINDFDQLETDYETIYDFMDYDLQLIKVTDLFSMFFDWFVMLNQNVTIFLTIILFVASFNIIAVILIMIMERTQMIGTLKALGTSNWQIQLVFIYNGIKLLLIGLLLGNAIGISFCFLQQNLKLIPLNAESYYMDYVPIYMDWNAIIFFNILTIIAVSAILFIPTFIISRVEPIKSIKFS